MSYSKLSVKGQIVIPQGLRRRFGLRPGSAVSVVEEHQKIVVYPAPEDPIEMACGFLKGGGSLAEELLKDRRREKKREQK